MTTVLDTDVTNYLLDTEWGTRGAEIVQSFWLLEDGSFFLQEFGDKIIVEESIPVLALLEDGTSYWLQEDGGHIIVELAVPPSHKPLLLDTEITNYLLGG